MKTCRSCKNFKPDKESTGYGHCMAPVPYYIKEFFTTVYPGVAEFPDKCSLYKEKFDEKYWLSLEGRQQIENLWPNGDDGNVVYFLYQEVKRLENIIKEIKNTLNEPS